VARKMSVSDPVGGIRTLDPVVFVLWFHCRIGICLGENGPNRNGSLPATIPPPHFVSSFATSLVFPRHTKSPTTTPATTPTCTTSTIS
jgi:hypothetical protein